MFFEIVHSDAQNKSYGLKWTEYATVIKSMHVAHATLQLIINSGCIYGIWHDSAWILKPNKIPSVFNYLTSVILAVGYPIPLLSYCIHKLESIFSVLFAV